MQLKPKSATEVQELLKGKSEIEVQLKREAVISCNWSLRAQVKSKSATEAKKRNWSLRAQLKCKDATEVQEWNWSAIEAQGCN